MAENQTITIPAHRNIYNGSMGRDLRIDFSIPKAGVMANTGLLIFAPGFGGNIDSNVYKKMRDIFADKYNLVTLQCAFFGDEFMQGAETFELPNGEREISKYLNIEELKSFRENPSNLLNLLSSKEINLTVSAKIGETEDNFNDMGFMQAIDIINSLEAIKIILKENNLSFNEQRVMGYGHSHGAYLLHLSNRLAPHLFSHIIDNSAWIEPLFLYYNRYLYKGIRSLTLKITFDYIAKMIISDKNALNLKTLYEKFDNQARIITYQGTKDNLIDYRLKQKIISEINAAKFILIDEKDVDGHIFKSNKHGLDADFLNMFELAYKDIGDYENRLVNKPYEEILLSKTKITVDYSQGLPIFTLEGI